jgi:hypothetical protein
MRDAMTRSGSSPTVEWLLAPAAGRVRVAVALLGLGGGLAAGGCGGAEPSRGGASALSRSPAHADATEPGTPGIGPLDSREPDAQEDAAHEEAPPPSEHGAPMDASGGPKEVAFVELQSQQTAGARTIEPSRHDAKAMETSGRGVVGVVKMCLDAAGTPTEVTPVRSTGYPDYDARIKAGVERWRFRPYLVGEKAVPVCSSVSISYRPDPPLSQPLPRRGSDASGG